MSKADYFPHRIAIFLIIDYRFSGHSSRSSKANSLTISLVILIAFLSYYRFEYPVLSLKADA